MPARKWMQDHRCTAAMIAQSPSARKWPGIQRLGDAQQWTNRLTARRAVSPRHADEEPAPSEGRGRHPRLRCGTQERHGWRAFAHHDGVGVVRATPDAVIVGRRLSAIDRPGRAGADLHRRWRSICIGRGARTESVPGAASHEVRPVWAYRGLPRRGMMRHSVDSPPASPRKPRRKHRRTLPMTTRLFLRGPAGRPDRQPRQDHHRGRHPAVCGVSA